MTPKEEPRRGLGRGLSALIGDENVPVRAEAPKATRSLPVAFLKPGKFQPRKFFGEEELASLAASIKEKGVLSPILVRPLGGESYEIVAGERRWRAAQLAKLHDVPVVVRELADAEALELAIIENVQRADLNVLEEAQAYQELIDRFGRTQEQVAQEVGKSRPHVANTIRLLKLPEGVRALIRDGKLTAGHARTLLGAPDPEAAAREILAGGMNVRQAEQRSVAKKKPVNKQRSDTNINQLESSTSNALGLKVHVLHKVDKTGDDKGGEIRVYYKTLEQLDEVVRRLSKV